LRARGVLPLTGKVGTPSITQARLDWDSNLNERHTEHD
jgi:hypothetical protein